MTGLLLIGRRPSAHKSAMAFFICFLPKLSGEIESPSGLGRLSVSGGGEVGRAAGSRLLEPSSGPPHLRFWGARLEAGPSAITGGALKAAGPAHVAGGRARWARRPPHNGGHRRPRAPLPPRAPRTAGALEGSRAGLPRGGGEGNAGPRARRAPAGISHTSQ